jgi:hypothetical protein
MPVLWVLGGGLALALVAFLYFMTTSVENPPPDVGIGAPTPSTDAVPNNAEPTPANPK